MPRSWTLDPAGDWHYRWISLMVLPILYNWVVLILRCCFPEVQEAHAGLWQALDGLSDALYLLDIAVHCHTGFLEDGILVTDISRARRRYLGSWTFPWDVMAMLPTELLCLLPGVPRVPGVPAARANRCLRVPRLFEAFDRCETRTGWPNVFRMAKLMLYLLLGIHWHGCLYFALSAHLGLGVDPWVCPSSTRPLRRYLHSFYFSTLVLTTVGDTPAPQREEELLFLTAGFLLAVLGFATITGSISTVIVNLSSASTAFYPDAGPVRRYLRAWGVGGRLAGRVVRWHQHLRAQRKLPAEWEVLQHLPRGLRAEVAASVHLEALRRVGLFRSWEHGVLRQLVLRLRPQVFGPGEFVCRRGDVGREMYFIREGRLAVVAEDGVTQLAVLSEGLYFGEISLINIKGNTAGNRRTANILSIGYSDLFCLGKEDLAEVLAEFPCARAAMEAKGRELLLRMGQLDTGAEAAALAAEAEVRRRLQGLEVALEGLQTRAARLLAQLEASALRMALRVQRLEGRLRLRDRAEMLCRSENGTGNGPGTGNGTNGSLCDLLRRGLRGPPAPRGSQRSAGALLPTELDVAVRVVLYVLIFVLSVGGNALVVAVLALNRRLRTVTNCFLLSLALSDLLLALCCMPFTLLPGLMGAFIFGDVVCKLVAYLMGVSVAVSTFSLVAIAIERYSAICNPLQSRAWQTRSHACRVIAGTWALAALLMLPYAVYSTTRPSAPRPPPAQCTHHWPSERVRQVWYVLLLLVLFFIPGVVMTVAYGLISRELYRGIRFELDVKREVAAQRGTGGDPAPACDEGDGCYLQLSRPGAALQLRALGPAALQDRARINSSGAQLAAKRRVIRMLVVIVAMFFLCWLPIFAANTWRAFAPRAAQRALSGTPIAFIHLLSYTSACANPLIYCFMNRRFRKAFGATCAGWGCRRTCPRRPPEDEPPMASASLSKFSYTTVSSLGPP
ncbi:cyclic nucleotide-gated cation channel alpha-4-like protein [Turdus rufiventris]|nr:cyclic nucleotide-gated cation channel alpha-4-like protein [Turdus rufiventris]